MNRCCLAIGAHYDDLELGCGGTLLKLRDAGWDIHLITICNEDVPNRNFTSGHSRKETFKVNANIFNAMSVSIFEHPSNNLIHTDRNIIIKEISDVIDSVKPSVVYTQACTDINNDHYVVSDATRVACRPRHDNPVMKLYEYYVQGSSDWSFLDKRITTCVDVSKYMDIKIDLCNRYNSEIRDYPDPFSVEKIKHSHEHYGGIFGCKYAEVFNLIFERDTI